MIFMGRDHPLGIIWGSNGFENSQQKTVHVFACFLPLLCVKTLDGQKRPNDHK